MKVTKLVELEEAVGYSPESNGVTYTDITGARVFIPMSLLVRLYEGTKEHFERRGVCWREYTDSLFKEEE